MKPATQPLETAVQPGGASNPDDKAATSTLNSPQVDESGKPTQRAITTAAQAHGIAKVLRDRAKNGRIKTAAVIADKYNGAPPFSEADLSRTGQAWRNNFSTNFLASIIDRVKPQMLDPINKSDVLTHSALPSTIENAAIKSRAFCEETTKCIRRWPAWRDFASQLTQENTLFGLAVPAWIDNPTEWRPHLWRFDEAFLPEGTGQHSSSAQVAVFSQKMLIHDFMDLYRDKKAAEKAAYNIENCIKATNANPSGGNTNSKADETELQKEDRAREGNGIADSYADGAKTIDLFHVLVRDYSGGVDLWTVTQDEGMEIRCVEDMHESMSDGLTFFTFQSGNGKLYGSKGLGRLLTNLHIAIERGRCLGADQLYLSGLIIFKSDKKDAAALQARVRHPFVFVDKGLELVEEQITFQVQAFEMMDAKLTQLAESIAGAFIPPNLNQEGANTKIEAAQNAEREMAVKEGVLGRFFDHLSDLISTMQKKIYCDVNLREGKRAWDRKMEKQQKGVKVLARAVWKLLQSAFKDKNKTEPDVEENIVADEDAVTAVMSLLEQGLTVEDIAMLALSPSAQTNATDGAAKDNATVNFIAENSTNPFLDQRAATKMAATISIGQDRANQLLIPQDDPQVESLAIRQQLIECATMNTGEGIPVAASDKHDTHRKVLASKFDGIMASLQHSPSNSIISIAELFFSHYLDHLKLDQMMPPDQKAQEMKAIMQDVATVEKVKKQLAKQQADLQAQGVTAGVDGMPVPVSGQPPQVDPATGRVVGEQSQSIHPADADLKLKIHELGQEDQRIQLAQQQHELEASKVAHSQAIDALKLQQGNAQMVQQAGQDSAAADQLEKDRVQQGEIEAAKIAAQPESAVTKK